MTEQRKPMTVDLTEQVAIVTGASQGLGQSMAIALARAGAKVACVARNPEKLADTVGTITQEGGVAEAYSCDVKDRKSVDSVVDSVTEK